VILDVESQEGLKLLMDSWTFNWTSYIVVESQEGLKQVENAYKDAAKLVFVV